MNELPIGIFGGTFDPIHHGHLRLAQEAFEQCNLASVRFIPSGTPPHRNKPHSSAQQRLAMVRLSLQDNAAFTLDEREIHRTEPCYTVDTLTSLRDEVGKHQSLCLLVGGDAFLLLHTWHKWKKLFSLAHIVVVQRAGRPLGNGMANGDPVLHKEYQSRLVPSTRVLHESAAGSVAARFFPLVPFGVCFPAQGADPRHA